MRCAGRRAGVAMHMLTTYKVEQKCGSMVLEEMRTKLVVKYLWMT